MTVLNVLLLTTYVAICSFVVFIFYLRLLGVCKDLIWSNVAKKKTPDWISSHAETQSLPLLNGLQLLPIVTAPKMMSNSLVVSGATRSKKMWQDGGGSAPMAAAAMATTVAATASIIH